MGMYDTVQVIDAVCSSCGELLKSLQSKSGPCELRDLTLEELWAEREEETVNFYDKCDNCGTWNDFEIVPPKAITYKRVEDGVPSNE